MFVMSDLRHLAVLSRVPTRLEASAEFTLSKPSRAPIGSGQFSTFL